MQLVARNGFSLKKNVLKEFILVVKKLENLSILSNVTILHQQNRLNQIKDYYIYKYKHIKQKKRNHLENKVQIRGVESLSIPKNIKM